MWRLFSYSLCGTVSALAVLTIVISAGQLLAADSKGLLSKSELKQLVAKARTAEDHLKLARHYSAKAAEHEAEAQEHEALAAEYRRSPPTPAAKQPMSGRTAEHCEYFAKHCRNAAKELRAMAAMHEEQAQKAGK